MLSGRPKRTQRFFSPISNLGCACFTEAAGRDRLPSAVASRVEPAPTVGMDASESVIETARSLAKAKAASYLTFEVGNIY